VTKRLQTTLQTLLQPDRFPLISDFSLERHSSYVSPTTWRRPPPSAFPQTSSMSMSMRRVLKRWSALRRCARRVQCCHHFHVAIVRPRGEEMGGGGVRNSAPMYLIQYPRCHTHRGPRATDTATQQEAGARQPDSHPIERRSHFSCQDEKTA
jgi:hypothetical protein